MKKLLGIVVLGLLLSGNSKAAPIKTFNVSIGCNSTGSYLRHLDRSKEDYFRGYASETNRWDGTKGPDFNLMIFLEDKTEEDYPLKHKWQGEITYLDHEGKKLYKPKGLYNVGGGSNIRFSIVAVSEKSSMGYMDILNISEWETSETKEDYYEVTKTRVKNVKEAISKKNKQLDRSHNSNDFIIYSDNYVCFK